MTRRPLVAIVLAVVLSAAACSSGSAPDATPATTPPRPTVVVTTAVLGDLVRNAVGDAADVRTLTPAGADPSATVVLTEGREAVAAADIVVANGLGADPDVGPALDEARARGHVVLEVAPTLAPVPETGPEPTRLDPRVWLDPDRATQIARQVSTAVARRPGVDAAQLRATTEAYARRLAQADEQIQAALLPLPDQARSLATTEPMLGYVAARYGLTVVGSLRTADGRPVDLPDALAASMRAAGATVVVTGPVQPPELDPLTAALGPGAEVVPVTVDTLGPPGGPTATLIDLLTTLARTLAAALTP